MNIFEPIIAIASAKANAGVGIIRLSGKNLQTLVEKICRQNLSPRHAYYLNFWHENNIDIIDKGIAIYFKAPNSFTGEDVLELQVHGGQALLQLLLKNCLTLGKAENLRLAEPGEFTKRAFLNQKIDLLQAEAIADIINADSEAAVLGAQRSMQGAFSQKLQELTDKIIYVRMLIEACLDFPEEDIEFVQTYQVEKYIDEIINIFLETLNQTRCGQILHDGINIVLVGQPNVGKSSLLNALSGEEIAIVSPIAGTTRDKISATIYIAGVKVHIYDTAGLRETNDVIENLGIEKTWQAVKNADIILHLHNLDEILNINNLNDSLINSGQNLQQIEKIKTIAPNAKILNIYNKIDLFSNIEEIKIKLKNLEKSNNLKLNSIFLSAINNIGIDTLRQEILNLVDYQPNNCVWLARERHLQALKNAQSNLQNTKNLFNLFANTKNMPLDILAQELWEAQNHLAELTGNFTQDDLLGKIFSNFCIGK